MTKVERTDTSSLSRRAFLGVAGTAAAAAATWRLAGRSDIASAAVRRLRLREISIQLYTLREKMDEDLDAVLAALQRIGYRKVEHAGFHGRTAEEFKAALDKYGLHASSGHQSVPHPYDEQQWQQHVDDAVTLEQRFIVHPIAYYALLRLGGGPQTPEPAWSDFAGALNQAGAKAKEAGLQLGYHNHSPEVEPYEETPDRRPIDTLMEETDPELVHFELDIYWCWKGGVDPIDLLKQYPGRFRQFHVKDMNEGGDFTTPGKGTIDFVRVFKAGKKLDRINQYIIEQDNAGENAIKSARAGFKLLRAVRF